MRDSKGRFAKPAPRPFQVGDRVRIKEGCDDPSGHHGMFGEITIDDGTLAAPLTVKFENNLHHLNPTAIYEHDDLELAEPAPQPKAEGIKPEAPANVLQRYVDVLRETNASKDAEIATLKAEVERLKERMEEGRESFDGLAYELTTTKAKLADIAAMLRVNTLMKSIPNGDHNPYGVIQHILDRQ